MHNRSNIYNTGEADAFVLKRKDNRTTTCTKRRYSTQSQDTESSIYTAVDIF
jgi:hypothetical protein